MSWQWNILPWTFVLKSMVLFIMLTLSWLPSTHSLISMFSHQFACILTSHLLCSWRKYKVWQRCFLGWRKTDRHNAQLQKHLPSVECRAIVPDWLTKERVADKWAANFIFQSRTEFSPAWLCWGSWVLCFKLVNGGTLTVGMLVFFGLDWVSQRICLSCVMVCNV